MYQVYPQLLKKSWGTHPYISSCICTRPRRIKERFLSRDHARLSMFASTIRPLHTEGQVALEHMQPHLHVRRDCAVTCARVPRQRSGWVHQIEQNGDKNILIVNRRHLRCHLSRSRHQLDHLSTPQCRRTGVLYQARPLPDQPDVHVSLTVPALSHI